MDLRNLSIDSKSNLLSALKKMDALTKKLLIVLDNEEYKGLLSAGDIQRALIKNKPLTTPVFQILRKNIRVGKPTDNFDTIKKMMFDYRMEFCPVVDEHNKIVNIHFWEELLQDVGHKQFKQFNIPVVIMAGGFGTRLAPLTKVLPKPLIPIGEKTMLEEIFDRFVKHGSKQFYISVNYKADLIEYYLKQQQLPYELIFVREKKAMGTAGSLSLLKGKITQTFFVNNCDILINQDYSEILNYHNTHNNEITIVAALKHYAIPYGIIETGNNGHLVELTEKPELTFKINSGMYLLEPHLLDEIPENEFFHITQLIEQVRKRKGKIGVFPVSEKSWQDIGEVHLLKQYYNA